MAAQPLDKPGDRLIMGIFGAMFCAAGVMGVVNVLLAGHARGPAIVAGIAVTTGILFGFVSWLLQFSSLARLSVRVQLMELLCHAQREDGAAG